MANDKKRRQIKSSEANKLKNTDLEFLIRNKAVVLYKERCTQWILLNTFDLVNYIPPVAHYCKIKSLTIYNRKTSFILINYKKSRQILETNLSKVFFIFEKYHHIRRHIVYIRYYLKTVIKNLSNSFFKLEKLSISKLCKFIFLLFEENVNNSNTLNEFLMNDFLHSSTLIKKLVSAPYKYINFKLNFNVIEMKALKITLLESKSSKSSNYTIMYEFNDLHYNYFTNQISSEIYNTLKEYMAEKDIVSLYLACKSEQKIKIRNFSLWYKAPLTNDDVFAKSIRYNFTKFEDWYNSSRMDEQRIRLFLRIQTTVVDVNIIRNKFKSIKTVIGEYTQEVETIKDHGIEPRWNIISDILKRNINKEPEEEYPI